MKRFRTIGTVVAAMFLALLVPARFCFADVIFSPTKLILIAVNDL